MVPPHWQGLCTLNSMWGFLVLGNTLLVHSCIVVWILFSVFTVFGIAVEPPLTATSLQSIHSLLFQPLYNGHFFVSPR